MQLVLMLKGQHIKAYSRHLPDLSQTLTP